MFRGGNNIHCFYDDVPVFTVYLLGIVQRFDGKDPGRTAQCGTQIYQALAPAQRALARHAPLRAVVSRLDRTHIELVLGLVYVRRVFRGDSIALGRGVAGQYGVQSGGDNVALGVLRSPQPPVGVVVQQRGVRLEKGLAHGVGAHFLFYSDGFAENTFFCGAPLIVFGPARRDVVRRGRSTRTCAGQIRVALVVGRKRI
jgi:hypothetical protein